MDTIIDALLNRRDFLRRDRMAYSPRGLRRWSCLTLHQTVCTRIPWRAAPVDACCPHRPTKSALFAIAPCLRPPGENIPVRYRIRYRADPFHHIDQRQLTRTSLAQD